MDLHEVLNKALELIDQSKEVGHLGVKSWFDQNGTFYISSQNIEQFSKYLEVAYAYHKTIYTRFSRQNIYKFIEKELVNKRKKNQHYTNKDAHDFFGDFEKKEPCERYIIAPISGVRLDDSDKINISEFEIGKASQLKSLLSNDKDGYYISVKIQEIYDESLAILEAKNKFLDFVRLVVFISGKNDKKINIKIGLPAYPSISHEQMYIETSSYQIAETLEDRFPSNRIDNTYLEKIPIDNEFFCKNEDFMRLWKIYEKKELKNSVSKMEKRLLNAAIAIGESASSQNIKNSVIYTSMALEILFSFDEGSLFQRSIGEKLSDVFAFLVGTDKESRKNASKMVKTFYRLRSALVHGGNTEINNDYIVVNIFLRAVINKLLNDEEYKHVKNIDKLYEMVKEAQYSY